MNRRFAAFSVLAALVLGFLLVRTDAAEANQSFMSAFDSEYPSAAAKLSSCSTCHTSAPSLNSYGAAFKSAGKTFTAALAAADSDGDGATNGAEIAAGTFPGDASDKPAVATTTTVTTAPPSTSPTTPSTTPSSSTSTTSTTVATATAAPVTAAATTTADAGPVVFPMTIDLGAAGSVILDLVEGKLVAKVLAAEGWTSETESEDDEIEIEFRNGESEIEFEAEYEDGDLKIKIEDESRDHDDDDEEDDDDRSGHDNHDEDEKRGRGHDDDDDDDDDEDDDD